MIRRKKKYCKGCETEQYLFGKGLCQSCYQKEARKKDIDRPNTPHKPLSRTSKGKMPLRTKKRSQQEKEYTKIISDMDKQKNIECFFCGKRMERAEDHHHLAGRDGALITRKEYIVHAHRKCHAAHHDLPVSKLPWWNDFLNRLSDIDTLLAYKESLKKDK